MGILDRHDVFIGVVQDIESHDAVSTARAPWELDVGISVAAEHGGHVWSQICEQFVGGGYAV